MKVGIISRTIPPFDRGGIQTHVLELSKALADEGIEVHLFIIGDELKTKKIHVHPVKFIPLPRLTIGQYISFSINAVRILKRFSLDLIHGHSMYSFGYAMMKRAPYVITLHGTQLNEFCIGIKSGFNFNHAVTDLGSVLMELCSARRADKVIVVSEENRRDVIAQYKIEDEKIRVIPNGVHTSDFQQSSCDARDILFVGRLHERKGIALLLKAFVDVHREVRDARLIIVGSGEEEKRLKVLAKRLGIDKATEFKGFVSDQELKALYSTAGLFVLPSYYEGFGIVLIEAMASGLPLVSVRTGSAIELIENGKNGFITDYEGMADSIIKVLENDKLRKSMGEESLRRVKRYEWRNIARMTIDVYDEVLNQ